jgi:hypothetical protein
MILSSDETLIGYGDGDNFGDGETGGGHESTPEFCPEVYIVPMARGLQRRGRALTTWRWRCG